MQTLTPYTPPDVFSSPTEALISKLNPKYLSHIRMINPDIFDLAMLDLLGMKAYNIFWKYLAHGAIYASNDFLILRTYNDIRIFSCSIEKVKCIIFRHKGVELEKVEELIPFPDFYQFLDRFIRDFRVREEPLHVDLLTTRYYETLPIDITVTKAAFDKIEKMGLNREIFLYVKADIDNVVIILPAFFNRLQTLFIDPSTFKANSLVAPVLSNRRALHVAQTTLKAIENERKVYCTTDMERIQSFKMKDIYVKLSLGNNQYVVCQKKFIESTLSFLRIFIDYSHDLPWIEQETQGIG